MANLDKIDDECKMLKFHKIEMKNIKKDIKNNLINIIENIQIIPFRYILLEYQEKIKKFSTVL